MSFLSREAGIAEQLAALGAQWLPAEPLSAHTSLGVGGRADLVCLRETRRLSELGEYFRRRGITWRLLGGGTNLLVVDEGLDDVVLRLVREPDGLKFDGRRVAVPAAALLGTAVTECAKQNLGGMEGLVGIPGTVGGALWMNAGAYGTQIGDVVRGVTLYRGATGRVEVRRTENLRFEYRQSGFAADDVLLWVTLEFRSDPMPRSWRRSKSATRSGGPRNPSTKRARVAFSKTRRGILPAS